jgi:hypothetical protein
VKSKAEVIREQLAGLRVLDIGGAGYGEDNSYEQELKTAWSVAKERTSLDWSDRADIRVDLNRIPLPKLDTGRWDITAAFDVLEHLEHPVEILRSIPTPRLLVSVPNATSYFARRMEEGGFEHLFSFTRYTASVMLRRGGWKVERSYYTFGKWSLLAKTINTLGSVAPSYVGTGIMFHCSRDQDSLSR